MTQINSLITFYPATKAKADEINNNFEILRLGHNDQETRLLAEETKMSNLNIINVKDYGAIGNGTTDDTVSITNALTLGKNIHFPSGTYKCTGITFDGHYVTFDPSAKLYWHHATTPYRICYVKGGSVLINPNIEGGATDATPTNSFGISIEGSCTLINPTVNKIPYDGIYCNPTGLPADIMVKILGGKATNCYRVSITPEHAQSFIIDGFDMSDAPSGQLTSLDLEPYDYSHFVNNLTIRNCKINKLSLYNLFTSTNVITENNTISNYTCRMNYPSKVTSINDIVTDWNVENNVTASTGSGTSIDIQSNKDEFINLIENAYCPNDKKSWTAYGASPSLFRDYIKIAGNAGTSVQLYQTINVIADEHYSFGLYAKSVSGNAFYNRMRVRWLTSAGATISEQLNLIPTTTKNEYRKLTTIMKAPATATQCRIDIGNFSTDATAEIRLKKVWACKGVVSDYVPSHRDKIYYNAAPSASGSTWEDGDIVFNSDAAAAGYLQWVCTTAGTAGTLSGVTGDITTGTKVLTVNSATNLSVGQYITIAGVTGVKKINAIDSTTITIDSNANATVTTAAIAYSAVTFKTCSAITA